MEVHSAMVDSSPCRPWLKQILGRARYKAKWTIRDLRPNRWVVREVGGVRMAMPWSHRLPDYAHTNAAYGQNLLALAELLGTKQTITVLDVGANIGDSTLLILDRTDARVLAVEPDEVFLRFLRHNVSNDPRVVVVPALLTTGGPPRAVNTVRVGGTARFMRDEGGTALSAISVEELRNAYPLFTRLRLVKCDTDGYDVTLVPAIARVWADARPVFFFEYDHRASRLAGHEPLNVWEELAALGYASLAVWDNGGHPLFRSTTRDIVALARELQPASPRLFWDVAAVHVDDAEALDALERLLPSSD
jgi:FkbM family methyltransferase